MAGDRVAVVGEDEAWPDWLLCRETTGAEAWLPREALRVDGDSAVLSRDFDTTELTVTSGAVVTVLRTFGGWAWCVTPDHRAGWIPIDKLIMSAGDDKQSK